MPSNYHTKLQVTKLYFIESWIDLKILLSLGAEIVLEINEKRLEN